jgi:hypothetical protein
MFLLPKLDKCDGSRGFLGVDWCRSMKAGVEGASRGVAIGRGGASRKACEVIQSDRNAL